MGRSRHKSLRLIVGEHHFDVFVVFEMSAGLVLQQCCQFDFLEQRLLGGRDWSVRVVYFSMAA
jgi:hypothetical protein